MNPPATTMIEEQVAAIEANLARLSQMMPALPKSEVLLARLVLFLAHDIGMMLEHQIRPYGLGEGRVPGAHGAVSPSRTAPRIPATCVRGRAKPGQHVAHHRCAGRARPDYARPCAEDRRRQVLRITDKGIAVVQHLLPALFAPLRSCPGRSPPRNGSA